jgi:hypothetical protein
VSSDPRCLHEKGVPGDHGGAAGGEPISAGISCELPELRAETDAWATPGRCRYGDAEGVRRQEGILEDGDAELQDLVLTVHHCFMLSLMNTHAHKIIENHLGRAMVKQTAPQFMLQMPPGLSPAPARGSPT